ncbi:hypothetical protein ACLG6S_03495 [Thermodesulfobacteriota bacterium B35]
MRTNIFFNGSWAGQLLVGCGLFLCSLLIEYRILLTFLAPASLALLLTLTLEGGKVAAVIWHYYLGYLSADAYPSSIRLTSLVFRSGLFILSMLCSMLFLTAHLDRPNLTRVRQERLAAITARARAETERVRARFGEKRRLLMMRQQEERASVTSRYQTRIDRLENLLRREMDNVVNGVFRGPRYRELERRLQEEEASLQQELEACRQRQEKAARNLEEGLEAELRTLQSDTDRRLRQVASADYSTDEEVNDPRIVALLNTAAVIFHHRWQPLQFVFFFSILVSLLMEAGIMLAFATITMAIAPVLHARHLEELEKEATRVRAEGAVAQETIRHRAAMEQVRRAGSHIMEQAEITSREAAPGHDGPAAE